MPQTSAFGAPASDQPLASLAIERREPGPKDVSIDILYCGVCHSDLHFVRGEWGQQKWPIVPGHEIVGRVTAVGDEVEGFAVGELAGVGCMVDSCRTCSACAEDLEQFCENGNTLTYGSEEKQTGGVTQGGYSKRDRRRPGLLPARLRGRRPGRRPRRCSAPGSPPTRRSATGTSAPTRRSASSGSAGSATWR